MCNTVIPAADVTRCDPQLLRCNYAECDLGGYHHRTCAFNLSPAQALDWLCNRCSGLLMQQAPCDPPASTITASPTGSSPVVASAASAELSASISGNQSTASTQEGMCFIQEILEMHHNISPVHVDQSQRARINKISVPPAVLLLPVLQVEMLKGKVCRDQSARTQGKAAKAGRTL